MEQTFTAIDLETTGKYPLDAEICEMAAVKWRGGRVIDTYQALIKPTFRMSDEVIKIHNITNEMVENSPALAEKLGEFHEFIKDSYIIAHHAPFDMGFLAWEFEKARLLLPQHPAFCTSLLSRHINFDVPNHRLATLAAHFQIEAGAAHRALDDAKACLGVALKYFEKLGPEAKISDIQGVQTVALPWARFSVESLTEKDAMRTLVRALRDRREVFITYEAGSRPGESRKVFPQGLVRNPEGDFLVATEGNNEGDDVKPKRYFLEKISAAQMAPI
ncbi:MAG TPA: exonuclease domain-containing protein [Bdellovibrionales bacterium]|nr:exonuclease domain-containing protein [Bdellovibrionales bacterium]